MTQEIRELAAAVAPAARLLADLRAIYPEAQVADRTYLYQLQQRIAREAMADIERVGRGAGSPGLVYVLFVGGQAAVTAGAPDLLEAIGGKFGYLKPREAVEKWLATAKAGDIGQFVSEEAGLEGWCVLVTREDWINLG